MRTGRLELPRVAPLEPKSSASTNSATFARAEQPTAHPEHSPQSRLGAVRRLHPYRSRHKVMTQMRSLAPRVAVLRSAENRQGGRSGTAIDSLTKFRLMSRHPDRLPSASDRYGGSSAGQTAGAASRRWVQVELVDAAQGQDGGLLAQRVLEASGIKAPEVLKAQVRDRDVHWTESFAGHQWI